MEPPVTLTRSLHAARTTSLSFSFSRRSALLLVQMRLICALSISGICFLTRVTCAVVPVFEDGAPAYRKAGQTDAWVRHPNDDGSHDDTDNEDATEAIQGYLLTRIEQCAAQTPDKYGMLIHIEDRTGHDFQASDEQQTQDRSADDERGFIAEKRFLSTIAKTWKNMPVEQRFQVIGTAAGVLAVPAYLSSSAQTVDEEQIRRIKQAVARKKVEQSERKSGPTPPKPSTASPPPPAKPTASTQPGPGNRTGNFKHTSTGNQASRDGQVHIQVDYDPARSHVRSTLFVPGSFESSRMYRRSPEPLRVPASTTRILNEGKDLTRAASFGSRVSSASSKVHHAPSSASGTASSHVASTASQVGEKQVKTPNATVSRVLTWTSLMTSLLYLPAATQVFLRTHSKDEQDLKKYRRRDHLEGQSLMPIVTCIPIAHVGSEDFIIPPGALAEDNEQNQSPDEEMPFPKRGRESAVLNSLGKNGKLVGLALLGGSMGFTMHQMSGKRDEQADKSQTLIRRAYGSSSTVRMPKVTAASEEEDSLVKRFTFSPGKGTVFFSSLLAGSAISRAGFGSPERHAVIEESKDKQAGKRSVSFEHRPSQGDLVRRNVRQQLAKGLQDKVTMATAGLLTGLVGVKSGAFDELVRKLRHKSAQRPSTLPTNDPPSKRSLIGTESKETVEGDEEGSRLARRVGRWLGVAVALGSGALVAQRTGKVGQRNENKQYLQQIGATARPNATNVESSDKLSKRDSMPQKTKAQTFASEGLNRAKRSESSASSKFENPFGNEFINPWADSRSMSKARVGRQPIRLPPGRLATVVAGLAAVGFIGRKAHDASTVRRGLQNTVEFESSALMRRGFQMHPQSGEVDHVLKEGVYRITHLVADKTLTSPHIVTRLHQLPSGGRTRSLTPRTRARSLSPSTSSARGRTMQRETMTHHLDTSPVRSISPQPRKNVEALYRDSHEVPGRDVIEEMHEFHHPESVTPAGQKQTDSSVSKLKGSNGKALIAGAAGVGVGAIGHRTYTNMRDGRAQVQDLAQKIVKSEMSSPPSNATAATSILSNEKTANGTSGSPEKRSLLATLDVEHDSAQQLSKRARIYNVLHEHIFHHQVYFTRIIPSDFVRNRKGAKDLMAAMIGSLAIAVFGHTFWSTAEIGQQQQHQGMPPVGSTASQEEYSTLQKRAYNASDVVQRHPSSLPLMRRAVVAPALTGLLAGITGASYYFSVKNGEPGTRRKHTVPPGTLPKNSNGEQAVKRSTSGGLEASETPTMRDQEYGNAKGVWLVRRGAVALPKLFKAVRGLSPKAKSGLAIGAGVTLSTATALMDPGPKEAKKPITRRELGKDSNKTGSSNTPVKRAYPLASFSKTLGPFMKNKTTRDAAIVAGVAGVAGAAGLLKRNLAADDDGCAPKNEADQAFERRGFEQKAGQMMDVASIAVMFGQGMHFAGTHIKNALSKGDPAAASKSAASRKGGGKRKRSIILAPDRGVAVSKREPGAFGALTMAATVVPMLKPAAKGAARAVKNLITKVKGKRDVLEPLEKPSALVKRSLAEGFETREALQDDGHLQTPSSGYSLAANVPWNETGGSAEPVVARSPAPSGFSLINKASIATIVGGLAAPVIKQTYTHVKGVARRPISPSPQRRNASESSGTAIAQTQSSTVPPQVEYKDLIEAMKKEAEKKDELEKVKKRDQADVQEFVRREDLSRTQTFAHKIGYSMGKDGGHFTVALTPSSAASDSTPLNVARRDVLDGVLLARRQNANTAPMQTHKIAYSMGKDGGHFAATMTPVIVTQGSAPGPVPAPAPPGPKPASPAPMRRGPPTTAPGPKQAQTISYDAKNDGGSRFEAKNAASDQGKSALPPIPHVVNTVRNENGTTIVTTTIEKGAS